MEFARKPIDTMSLIIGDIEKIRVELVANGQDFNKVFQVTVLKHLEYYNSEFEEIIKKTSRDRYYFSSKKHNEQANNQNKKNTVINRIYNIRSNKIAEVEKWIELLNHKLNLKNQDPESYISTKLMTVLNKYSLNDKLEFFSRYIRPESGAYMNVDLETQLKICVDILDGLVQKNLLQKTNDFGILNYTNLRSGFADGDVRRYLIFKINLKTKTLTYCELQLPVDEQILEKSEQILLNNKGFLKSTTIISTNREDYKNNFKVFSDLVRLLSQPPTK